MALLFAAAPPASALAKGHAGPLTPPMGRGSLEFCQSFDPPLPAAHPMGKVYRDKMARALRQQHPAADCADITNSLNDMNRAGGNRGPQPGVLPVAGWLNEVFN